MKQDVTDFAVLGGAPVFEEPLLVGRPNRLNSNRFLNRIQQVLDSGMLTNGGPMVQQFEARLQTTLNVKHVVAVCNGTMALQIMARANDLTGEVIVPSLTFIATAHALAWIGLTPVFADVDPATHTLNPESVERCVSSKTSAILGVHLWGNLCHLDPLREIADRYHLRLLFDGSHAFGCSRDHLGGNRFGNAEAISFHATKVMQAVEGGAILTDDDELAERCRLLRNFGITGLTQVEALGTNGKMNELCAAAGLTSLENADETIDHNNRNLQLYRSVIDEIDGLQTELPTSPHRVNAQYVVVSVDETEFGLSRDQLLKVLHPEGVFARSYFAPGCHGSAPYIDRPVHCPVPLPVTNRLLQQVMQLPTGTAVSEADIRQIGTLLRSIRQHRSKLQRYLQKTISTQQQTHPLPAVDPTADAA